MFYIVIIQSTGESLLFLVIASMANNCKTGECQKNNRESDSFIVLKKLGNANGGNTYRESVHLSVLVRTDVFVYCKIFYDK